MREIGVRELKQILSKTLHEVGRGEAVRVTLRGRALADIVPPGSGSQEGRLGQLVAEGRVVAPSRARPRQPPLLMETSRPASAFVLEERDAER
jgi:antitoxin (DNA-binding transcriptional repressor) of toxin-antitoxin stability system